MSMTDRELRDLTKDQLLDLIIEEAAETIQAATKIKRFGHFGGISSRNNGRTNADALIREALQVRQIAQIYCGKVGANYGNALENPQYELTARPRKND